MEGTEAADRQKEEAFNSLEFSDNNGEEAVRCQCCNNWIRIVGKLQRPKKPNDRISTLQKRIKWLGECQHRNNINKNKAADAIIKQDREELQRLQAEDAKYDKFRSLPLYSSKCTGYRFFCSPCWDQAYLIDQEQKKKEKTR